MIRSIRHKGLLRFFVHDDHRGIPARFAQRILRMLDRLDQCARPEDMDIPGYKFHALKGGRQGMYAINVSANWRLTFRFEDEDAVDVNLEDYH